MRDAQRLVETTLPSVRSRERRRKGGNGFHRGCFQTLARFFCYYLSLVRSFSGRTLVVVVLVSLAHRRARFVLRTFEFSVPLCLVSAGTSQQRPRCRRSGEAGWRFGPPKCQTKMSDLHSLSLLFLSSGLVVVGRRCADGGERTAEDSTPRCDTILPRVDEVGQSRFIHSLIHRAAALCSYAGGGRSPGSSACGRKHTLGHPWS